MKFPESKMSFSQFLGRSDLNEFSPRESGKCVGIIVTPWVSTPLPWYAVALSFLYNKCDGYKSLIIWDDLTFENGFHEIQENEQIGQILSEIGTKADMVRLSELSDTPVSAAELEHINRLAKSNVIWRRRTSVYHDQHQEMQNRFSAALEKNFRKIKTLMGSHKLDHIVGPGGIYGNSGLYLLAGKMFGVRTATYDCGNTKFFIGTNNVACYFDDVVDAYHSTLKTYGENSKTVQHIVQLAREEFEKRLAGGDRHKFQTVAISETASIPDFDVLIPLSIDWDAPGLGMNRFFSTPADWALETTRFILEHSKAKIVIRYHPYNRYLNVNDFWEEHITKNFHQFGDRVLFIQAEAKINSYDLLKKAKIVLPYVSTIAIEAVFYGKPVIIESAAHFSNLPFFIKATSKEDYFQKILSSLSASSSPITQKDIDNAFLYYYLFQIAQYLFVDFTPQPIDFTEWSKRDLTTLFQSPEVLLLLKALIENKPLSLFHIEQLASFQS